MNVHVFLLAHDYSLTDGLPSSIKCPYIHGPKNGMIRCEGRLCFVQCFTGYSITADHTFVYKCGEDSRWSTIPYGKPVPWPDCVRA